MKVVVSPQDVRRNGPKILSTTLVDKGQRCVYEEKGAGRIYITLATNYIRLS